MNPIRIYDYVVLARERVLAKVAQLDPQQYERQFDFGLRTIGSTLAHLMVSEWYYIERLQGREVPPYEQWPIHYESPPPFAMITRTWHEQADRVKAAIATERDWSRTITWLSFPDDSRGNRRFHITCTAGDMIAQLSLHEVHHRAQVMVMLRALGHPISDIDYNDMMYDRREAS